MELAIVIHALKMWRHYLLGKTFLLLMDHHSLTNYFNQPTMNARQAHWIDSLSEFDFDIKHIKGKENHVAHALSRKVNSICGVSFSQVHTTFVEKIKEATIQDPEYNTLWQQAKNLDNNKKQLGYEVNQEGLFVYRGIIYVPNQKNIKQIILDE